MGFANMFHGLWERLGGSHAPEAAEAAPDGGMADTQSQLEAALEQLSARVVSYKKSHDIADVKEYSKAEIADREDVEMRKNADILKASILREHERLQTGLTAERIEVVSARMHDLAERGATTAKTMAERLDEGVRVKALAETGALAWAALEEAMSRHGVRWPDPTGMGHAPTEERVAQVRRMEAARMRAGFLGTRPRDTAEMAEGLIRVWKTVYPEPTTNLYVSTTLEGVGSGLWCFYAAVAQAIALKNRAALEQKANELLAAGLSRLSELLATSPEIDPAVESNVKFRAQEIIADAIPDMVWAEIGPQVRALVPGEEADRLLADVTRTAVPA